MIFSRHRRRHVLGVAAGISVALALGACGGGGSDSGANRNGEGGGGATVTITHARGTAEVPVNPQTVVALNNSDFHTLSAMGVELAAAPVALMGRGLWPEYADNDHVADVGTHREPNLEVVIAAEPDLIITGMRFSQYYDQLVAQNPDAVVIDTSYDRQTDDIGVELTRNVNNLGKIFDREDVAQQLIDEYEAAVQSAQDAYHGTDTVMGVITSGGAIQYAAPVTGRALGPLFPILDLLPALDRAADDATHGDEISVEAIAAADPDWLLVLDRDGATAAAETGYSPAQEVIGDSEALARTTAIQQGQVVYLDPTFYLTEDIQAYTQLFAQLAEAFAAAS